MARDYKVVKAEAKYYLQQGNKAREDWLFFGISPIWGPIGARKQEYPNSRRSYVQYCRVDKDREIVPFPSRGKYALAPCMDSVPPLAQYADLFANFESPTARDWGYKLVIRGLIHHSEWPVDYFESIPLDVKLFMRRHFMIEAINMHKPRLMNRDIPEFKEDN